jgi:hypothetical protein
MPASIHRSRSPFKAWAVKAINGKWIPVVSSRQRLQSRLDEIA